MKNYVTLTDTQIASLDQSKSYYSQINWSLVSNHSYSNSPSMPVTSTPITTAPPAPSTPTTTTTTTTQQDNRSSVEKAEQTVFDWFGQANSSANTLIGNILGTLGDGTPSPGPRGTTIYNNIKENSLTGSLMTSVSGDPITIGYVILTTKDKITDPIMNHELGHVTQSAILGPLYLPLIGLDRLIHPAWGDRWMEVGPLHPDWPSWR